MSKKDMPKADAQDIKKECEQSNDTCGQENEVSEKQESQADDVCNSNTAENSTTDKGQEQSEKKEPEEDENTKYLRLMADFQNYKKRVEKEKNDIYAFANEKIVLDLLDVIDNFDRALDGADIKNENEGFASGMNMIYKQLKGVLEKAGVNEIPALGEDFDPNFHNAVMMEDTSEFESGKVSAVLQKGYLLNNKVIRASMVKVAN